MPTFLIIAVVLVALSCNARSQQCPSCPFRYPEMYFDYRDCSTTFDWSRSIAEDCRDDLASYSVQFINIDCNRTFNATEEDLYKSGYSPGQCLAEDGCYARVRALLRDGDTYRTCASTWTGLSQTYQMFHACVIEGNDICLPIQLCSGFLPTFLVNGKACTPGYNDNIFIKNDSVCLRRVTNDIHYLEVCHKKRSFCSSPSANEDSEYVISKRGQIEVTTNNCGSCYNQCGLEANSSFAQNNHCVAIDWKMIDSTSNTLRNVCLSTESSLQNHSSSMMLYSLQLIINSSSEPATTQSACDEYSDIIIHNESHSISLAEREELGIMICNDSKLPLKLSLSSNTSDIGTTQCAPSNSAPSNSTPSNSTPSNSTSSNSTPSNDNSRLEGYIIALIVIGSMIIIIIIITILIIIIFIAVIIYYLHGWGRSRMYVLPHYS